MSQSEKQAGDAAGHDRRTRLLVNPDKCQGHNRCHVLLPQLITVDDLGFAQVQGDGRVPPELLDQARLAVRNCPEFALRLTTATDGDPA